MAAPDPVPIPLLPNAPLLPLAPTATLQPPLSRRGHGPGLVLVTPGTDGASAPTTTTTTTTTLDPPPQKKWAEEGYAVARLVFSSSPPSVAGEEEEGKGADDGGGNGDRGWEDVAEALGRAVEALGALAECDGEGVYGSPSEYPPGFAPRLKAAYEGSSNLVASVSFSADWGLGSASKPALLHLGGPPPLPPPDTSAALNNTKTYHYPGAPASPSFVLPRHPSFSYTAASVSHTRSLTFLKPLLGGPYFDLEAVWEEHTAYEFGERSVERTMSTMVDEPYVNHVPTLAGGVGRAALTAFYRDRFIFANPADAALELVSRTVGIDRVVDEFVFSLTHDRVVDWLLPGLPPTHKPLRIPFTAVVNLRGDRLYHEHIAWDQATVLRQLGLLPEYLPFPLPFSPSSSSSSHNNQGDNNESENESTERQARLEYRVPAAGAETAAKLADGAGSAVESNGMFAFEVREGRGGSVGGKC
ncbi:hypothetical protein F4775DRAFT_601269 [Biscogniauxia sp. FL1348]|nr:hypothetical protein F4775DRAFT_601269 [Biscogniauxia sp. FL1348]